MQLSAAPSETLSAALAFPGPAAVPTDAAAPAGLFATALSAAAAGLIPTGGANPVFPGPMGASPTSVRALPFTPAAGSDPVDVLAPNSPSVGEADSLAPAVASPETPQASNLPGGRRRAVASNGPDRSAVPDPLALAANAIFFPILNRPAVVPFGQSEGDAPPADQANEGGVASDVLADPDVATGHGPGSSSAFTAGSVAAPASRGVRDGSPAPVPTPAPARFALPATDRPAHAGGEPALAQAGVQPAVQVPETTNSAPPSAPQPAAFPEIAAARAESPTPMPEEKSIPEIPAVEPDPMREEIFAAAPAEPEVRKNVVRKSATKTFLSAGDKQNTKQEPELGIGGAKSVPVMSTALFSSHRAPAPAPFAPASFAVAPVEWTSGGSPVAGGSAAVEARRAVETVLAAAERLASGERRSVSLDFSVGGNDLNVRVELRADEVHATFRTDSPELRSALAREWQAVNSAEADRPHRLAEPMFTTSTAAAGGFSAFTGDGASRQRDPEARASEKTFGAVAPRSRGLVSRAVEAVTAPVAQPTALHLHTFA